MSELTAPPNNLICGVQSLGFNEDCNAPLISDGLYWRCPYNHVQGFDGKGNPVRAIRDYRGSVRQGEVR